MVQPLIFLGLYGPLLGGVPGLGSESPWQWFVPGILVMMTLFGTSMSARTCCTRCRPARTSDCWSRR